MMTSTPVLGFPFVSYEFLTLLATFLIPALAVSFGFGIFLARFNRLSKDFEKASDTLYSLQIKLETYIYAVDELKDTVKESKKSNE